METATSYLFFCFSTAEQEKILSVKKRNMSTSDYWGTWQLQRMERVMQPVISGLYSPPAVGSKAMHNVARCVRRGTFASCVKRLKSLSVSAAVRLQRLLQLQQHDEKKKPFLNCNQLCCPCSRWGGGGSEKMNLSAPDHSTSQVAGPNPRAFLATDGRWGVWNKQWDLSLDRSLGRPSLTSLHLQVTAPDLCAPFSTTPHFLHPNCHYIFLLPASSFSFISPSAPPPTPSHYFWLSVVAENVCISISASYRLF